MSRRTIVLSVSSIAILALVAVAVFATGPGGAVAHGRWGGHGGWGDHKGWGGHGAKALCTEQRDIRLSAATGFVEAFVSFTPEQSAAWNTLKAALQAGSQKIGEACESADAKAEANTAPQRLARVELALGTALGIVQDVRPAFEDLYSRLSDEQRERIDALASRHRHHRR